jgi:thioredoxin-like negative regulator of GroEL
VSAIQDAIRKAKREREEAMGPQRMKSMPVVIPPSSRRRRLTKVWAAALLLVFVGAMGGGAYIRGWLRIPFLGSETPQGGAAKVSPDPSALVSTQSQESTAGRTPVSRPDPGSPPAGPGMPRRPFQAGGSDGNGVPKPAAGPPSVQQAPRGVLSSGGPSATGVLPAPGPVQKEAEPANPTRGGPSYSSAVEEARKLRAAGDLRGAEEVLKRELERDPRSLEALVALANLYLRDLQEPQKSLPLYQQALKLEPERATLHVNVGVYYLKTGDLGKAEEYLDRALALDSSLAEAYYNQACLLSLQGDRSGAAFALRQAVQLDPRSVEWAKEDPDLSLIRGPMFSPRPPRTP